jgi:hypothetical protein
MAKNTDAFGGFNELVDMIIRTDKDPEDVTRKNDTTSTIKLSKSVDDDIDDEEKDTTDLTPGKDSDKIPVKDSLDEEDEDDTDTDGDADDGDDNEDKDDAEEVKGKKKTTKDTETSTETTDLGEVEPELSEYFANSLVEKLGIDVNKDTKFEKLDDVVDLMSQVIEANSVPTFASDEVEEYDTYVKNGGNLKSFYDQVYANTVDPDRLDIEDEKDQKLAIEANLKNLGYKDDKIKKTIDRYTDAEVLKDEAQDAIESIKEFQVKKAKTLLATQEKERIEADKRNQVFVQNVMDYVNNLKDIQGVEVDSKTKKEIIDYIFRVTPDGSTQFQKAYASDVVKNLVGSAYYIKYGDSLLSKTSKKATDAALNKVREKLKASKGKRNTGSGGSQSLGKVSPNFSTLSSLIIK